MRTRRRTTALRCSAVSAHTADATRLSPTVARHDRLLSGQRTHSRAGRVPTSLPPRPVYDYAKRTTGGWIPFAAIDAGPSGPVCLRSLRRHNQIDGSDGSRPGDFLARRPDPDVRTGDVALAARHGRPGEPDDRRVAGPARDRRLEARA